MGCDIHAMVEIRKGGKWVVLTEPIFCGYDNKPTTDPYDGRNYDLFSMLADVRNGYGFAGAPTGDGYLPIAPPRGVPEDPSPEYAASVEYWEADGHSHSWLTLAELQSYDWTQTTQKRGLFSEGQWVRALRDGKRTSWSSGVTGPGVLILTPDEYLGLLGDGWPGSSKRDCSKSYYIEDRWERVYAEAAGTFYTDTLPKLATLGRPEDVRLVFFFDN